MLIDPKDAPESKAVGVFGSALDNLQRRIKSAHTTHEKEKLSELALLFREANTVDPKGKTAKIIANDIIPNVTKTPGLYRRVKLLQESSPDTENLVSDSDKAAGRAADRIGQAIASGEIKGWDTMDPADKATIAHRYFFDEVRSVTDSRIKNINSGDEFMQAHGGQTQAEINAERKRDENGKPTNTWKEFWRHPIDMSVPGIAGFLPDMVQLAIAARGGRAAAAEIPGTGRLARIARPIVENVATMLPFAKHEIDAGYAMPIEHAMAYLRDNGLPLTYDNLVGVYQRIDEANKADPNNKSADVLYQEEVNKGRARALGTASAGVPIAGVGYLANAAKNYVMPRLFSGHNPAFIHEGTGWKMNPGNISGFEEALGSKAPGVGEALKRFGRDYMEHPIYPGSLATVPISNAQKWGIGAAEFGANVATSAASLATMEPTAKLVSNPFLTQEQQQEITWDDAAGGAMMGLQFSLLHPPRPWSHRPDKIHIPTMAKTPEGVSTLQDLYIQDAKLKMRQKAWEDRAHRRAAEAAAQAAAQAAVTPQPTSNLLGNDATPVDPFTVGLPGLKEWLRQRDIFLGDSTPK